MSLIWPQKMYAMARHLQLVKRKLPGVTRHEPSHFAIEPTEAVASKEYGDLNRQLAFEAAELRDRIGGGEYPIRHHKNLAIVKTGKVEKISGFTFTEVWGAATFWTLVLDRFESESLTNKGLGKNCADFQNEQTARNYIILTQGSGQNAPKMRR